MSDRDWADSEYERVYWTIVDDPKMVAIYADNALLAWWLRLLIMAGQSYPHSQSLPRRIPDDVLSRLVELQVVRLAANDQYTVAGMKKEREGRTTFHSEGGKKRAASAERDEKGHFLPVQQAGVAGSSSAGPALPPSSPSKYSTGKNSTEEIPVAQARATDGNPSRNDGWETFHAPEWYATFKTAWSERFKLPPWGEEDDEESQRGRLWPIVRDNPMRVSKWVRGAPRKASAQEVVAFVWERYDEIRGDADDEPIPEPRSIEPMRRLKDIMDGTSG